jgi:hypothetical protein
MLLLPAARLELGLDEAWLAHSLASRTEAARQHTSSNSVTVTMATSL